MASPFTTTIPNAADAPKPALTAFRLGEDHWSDSSDSDQSERGERSLSPSKAQRSRASKKKERKEVGALTDELGIALGNAFQNPDDAAASGTAQQATEEAPDVDLAPAEKRMSRRTRQNLEKMKRRKAHHELWMANKIAREEKQIAQGSQRKQKSNKKKKNPSEARREKKQRKRAKKAAANSDAMEIE